MKDTFAHREKIKRIERACALLKDGKPLHEIASFFGVSDKTVTSYIEESQRTEIQKGKDISLAGFAAKTTSLDTLFTSSLKEGFKCARCKRYAKREAGILWEKNVFLCKPCYFGLDKDL